MLTSFYLGLLFLYIIQEITYWILFDKGFISNVRIFPLFNILPSKFLSYIGLWFLLFLAVPVFGMLLRVLDKNK